MDKQAQIRERLKEIMKGVAPEFSMLAQVKEVSEAEFTCTLYDEESTLEFFDVRLRPVLDGKECVTIMPKLDTWALAVRIEDSDEWMVVAVGEAQKIHIKCDEIVINGGTKGGLVNWPDAKTQLDKTNEVVQALVNALTNWTPIANDGGAALKTYASTQLAGKQVGNFANLEDTKVKH